MIALRIGVIVALSFVCTTIAAGQTIPQRAALADGDLHMGGQTDGPNVTLAELVTSSDLIVRGVTGQGRSSLSQDQMSIYTEFPIRVAEVIYARQPRKSRTPSLSSLIVVRQVGGDIELGGKHAVLRDFTLPQIPAGTSGIFLLHQHDDGSYALAGDYFGAFELRGSQARPMATTRIDKIKEVASTEDSLLGAIRALIAQ
jgi:hypothetical protein